LRLASWDLHHDEVILAETMSLVTKRLTKGTAVRFNQGIRASARFRIDKLTPKIKDAACCRLPPVHESARQGPPLHRLSVLRLMDAVNLREVFRFDRHYARYGFRLLPDSDSP
jgi:predicted nucleic acid-binding protein